MTHPKLLGCCLSYVLTKYYYFMCDQLYIHTNTYTYMYIYIYHISCVQQKCKYIYDYNYDSIMYVSLVIWHGKTIADFSCIIFFLQIALFLLYSLLKKIINYANNIARIIYAIAHNVIIYNDS